MLLRYLTSSTSWLMKTSLEPPCLPNNAQKQCKQIFESAMDKLVIRILYLFFSFFTGARASSHEHCQAKSLVKLPSAP